MSNNTEPKYLSLADIKIDAACQARAAMDTSTINEYVQIMKEESDDTFPAVVVFYDGKDHWLSDGFHRYQAAGKAGLLSIKAAVRQGSRRDAIFNAVGANAQHGLRRTSADKRRAVSILLEDPEWSLWSNRKIADCCGVDEKLVRTLRSPSAAKPQTARRVERNGTVYEMETGNIGRNDGLEELLSIAPDKDGELNQAWLVSPDTPSGDEVSTGATGAELTPSPDEASGSDEVQLQELLSAWARASDEVQQQFLVTIGVSLPEQGEADPGLTEAAPPSEREPSAEEVPESGLTTQLPRNNSMFDMWKNFKLNTRKEGLKWVADNCPDVYHDSHFLVTESLVPFRQAASAANSSEWAEFLKRAKVYQAENQHG